MTVRKIPDVAMVLAAGLGKRMRPLTETMPKPLIRIAGKPLLDWALDSLAAAGVSRAVVNVHHFPEQIVAHLAGRAKPAVALSDETGELLESGGGIAKALPLLGPAPFFIVNADTFWIDGRGSNLHRLALAWDPSRMDILLMLTDFESATGHSGKSDFLLKADGTLARSAGAQEGLVYAGAGILHPRIFENAPIGPHTLNVHFDRAIAAGGLHGVKMDGHWITVGTPAAIPLAERAVAQALAEAG
jgi:N-acetyl-alpha-D-muramate 1-phosphate uridylyltransferase